MWPNLPVLNPVPNADQRSSSLAASDAALPWAPLHPDVHLFQSTSGPHVFIPNGSRVYGLGQAEYWWLSAALQRDPGEVAVILEHLGLQIPAMINDVPLDSPPLRAISLAVAQKCNLGCTYCYAQQGDFGGLAKQMPEQQALAAVEYLFQNAKPGDRLNLAFLGGEPLLNREVIHAATERAVQLSAARSVTIGFSITTNGTLLTVEDADFFEQHGFAVSLSIDGIGDIHDRLRPFKGGTGSFAQIRKRVEPLLRGQRRMQVSARVTVTPRNLELPRTLDELIALGFHSVGFSPVLNAPSGHDEMKPNDLNAMLEQMISCGEEFERQIVDGRRYPFANMVNAMKEIHRGTHRPYPCGAGAGYMGVSADGELSACHRFVGDENGAMGALASGVDPQRQNHWLASRHVHRQEPCRSCWARYLCGGGCHHEVIHRGRPACAYIRGWLHYCLQAYVRLLGKCPDYFMQMRA